MARRLTPSHDRLVRGCCSCEGVFEAGALRISKHAVGKAVTLSGDRAGLTAPFCGVATAVPRVLFSVVWKGHRTEVSPFLRPFRGSATDGNRTSTGGRARKSCGWRA